MTPANRLDHFDRDQLVVATPQIAIVLEQDGDPVLDPGARCRRPRVFVLLARNRGRRDPATTRDGGVDGQGPPPRADLEQMIIRPEVELLADQLELRHLCLSEAHPRLFEYRAGVAHRRVEHPGEELVGQVVVGGDVAPAPSAGASPAQVAKPLHRRSYRRETRPEPVKPGRVAGCQADQRDEIWGVPMAGGVGLSEATATREAHPPRAGAADDHRGGGRARAVYARLTVLDHGQAAFRDPVQEARQYPPADPIDHDGDSRGWRNTGAPATFSCSAWE